MQVLLERLQKGKVFSLWMKYELAKDEEDLINKYNIRRTILVEGNPKQEKERAGKMAAVLAVVVGVGAMPFMGAWTGNSARNYYLDRCLDWYLQPHTRNRKGRRYFKRAPFCLPEHFHAS